MSFPPHFLWGAATSAHQVEGDNTASDWWAWEQAGRVQYRSGRACDHWNRYESDFDLAQSLGHNAHRFSIEWSRIEPEEGAWNKEAIEHYRSVIHALKMRRLEPIVTLHHFTNPKWFSDRGGWSHRQSPETYLRYVTRITQNLGQEVRYWITINEPLVYVYQSYLASVWPAPCTGLGNTLAAIANLERAHLLAYHKIHRILDRKAWHPHVGLSKAFMPFFACRNSFPDHLATWLRDYTFNKRMLKRIVRQRAIDFIGVNYYTRGFIRWGGKGLSAILGASCPQGHGHAKGSRNILGWEVYPQGLSNTLEHLKHYGLPIIITENGIATDNDTEREAFIEAHLEVVHKAIQDGLPVKGYLYWSLLDNFEWAEGTRPRFGLYEVNYKNFERIQRHSATKYTELIHT